VADWDTQAAAQDGGCVSPSSPEKRVRAESLACNRPRRTSAAMTGAAKRVRVTPPEYCSADWIETLMVTDN
jgi:hypothetical protein